MGSGSARPAVVDDEWDFEDYGRGETWDMERNRSFRGYALAGDVIAVGGDAADLAAGDRVVALHHHADLAVVPAHPSITLKIPDGVSCEEAAFCVPASVSLHAVHRANLRLGEDVVVMGAGLVGLLTIQPARRSGATPVVAVDLSPRRLELARRIGADFAIDPNREDLVARIRDCVGGVELDMYSEFISRGLSLIASQQPRNPVQDSIHYHLTGQHNRRTMLDLIRRGAINVKDLLTHCYRCTEAPEVYRLLGEAERADYETAKEAGKRRGDVHRDMIGVLLEWSA